MDGQIYFQNNIKKGLIYIVFWRKVKARKFKTIIPYDIEVKQGKKNNLPPKAPEPYVLDETFIGLFKPELNIIPPKNKDGIIPKLPKPPEPDYINEVFVIFPKNPQYFYY